MPKRTRTIDRYDRPITPVVDEKAPYEPFCRGLLEMIVIMMIAITVVAFVISFVYQRHTEDESA